jgi:hypothetical protein
VYFLSNELDYNDLFGYLLNQIFNQVEPKTNHLNKKWSMGFSQVGHLVKLDKKKGHLWS